MAAPDLNTSISADIQERFREAYKQLTIEFVTEIREGLCPQKTNKGAGDTGKGKGNGQGKRARRQK